MIIAIVLMLIAEDTRGYTSAKYLSEHITDLGFKKTKQSILPYIELAKSLRHSGAYRKLAETIQNRKSKKRKSHCLPVTICQKRLIYLQK
ncbi:MAG: hypothetical protein ACLRIP_11255 [Blautia massiliensis (ex Durand et al. 2017)]